MNHGHSSLKSFSKDYTRVLRHANEDPWMFDTRGTVELSVLFQKMNNHSPLRCNMNGAQFAAFLYAND